MQTLWVVPGGAWEVSGSSPRKATSSEAQPGGGHCRKKPAFRGLAPGSGSGWEIKGSEQGSFNGECNLLPPETWEGSTFPRDLLLQH